MPGAAEIPVRDWVYFFNRGLVDLFGGDLINRGLVDLFRPVVPRGLGI